jgi:hypothetical protein
MLNVFFSNSFIEGWLTFSTDIPPHSHFEDTETEKVSRETTETETRDQEPSE